MAGGTVTPNSSLTRRIKQNLQAKRYRLSGMTLPRLQDWFENTFGASVKHKSPATPVLNASAVPPPRLNEAFVENLKATGIPFSNETEDRVFRAHGHCLHEIFALREGKKFECVPDMVVWPNCHNDVVKIVELACKHNVCLIPRDQCDQCSRVPPGGDPLHRLSGYFPDEPHIVARREEFSRPR